MNHYPHHLGDYAKDTVALSQGQHGAYRLLMDAYYAGEEGIPVDDVYAISKANTPAERKNTDRVLAKFFSIQDGRWIQKRIEQEISAYRDRSRIAAEKAKKRWRNDAAAMPQHPPGIDSAPPPAMLASSHKPNIKPLASKQHGDSNIPADDSPLAALAAICLQRRVRTDGAKALLHLRQFVTDGVTEQQLTDAILLARDNKPDPEIIPLGYLAPILADLRAGRVVARPVAKSREELYAAASRLIDETEAREARSAAN